MSWDTNYRAAEHALAVGAALREAPTEVEFNTLGGDIGIVAQIITFLSNFPQFEQKRPDISNPYCIVFKVGRDRYVLRSVLSTWTSAGTYENHRPSHVGLFRMKRSFAWRSTGSLVFITQFSTPEQWNEAAAWLLQASTRKAMLPRGWRRLLAR